MASKNSLCNKRLVDYIKRFGRFIALPYFNCFSIHDCIIMPDTFSRYEWYIYMGHKNYVSTSWESVERVIDST